MSTTITVGRERERGADLYRAHADMLLRYCRRQLGSTAEAEDAVQTTFVYALRALRRGVEPENEEAWLTTIAGNVCHWQRRTTARAAVPSEIALDAPAHGGPGDHDELIGLDQALASMPERQRRALILREWRGLAPAEIAPRLGLSPTATSALLTRARSSLALALSVARQPALGVVWLLGELKTLVKAVVGSATGKAGVAAVTVVATTGVTAGLVVPPVEAEPRVPVAGEVAGRTAPGVGVPQRVGVPQTAPLEPSGRRAAAPNGDRARTAAQRERSSSAPRPARVARLNAAPPRQGPQAPGVVAEPSRSSAPEASPAVASNRAAPEQLVPQAPSVPAPQLPAPPSLPTVPLPQPTLPELPGPPLPPTLPVPPTGGATGETPLPDAAAAVGEATDTTAGRAPSGVLP